MLCYYCVTTTVLQRDEVVGRRTQAGTRVGNHERHTHRRETTGSQHHTSGKPQNTPTQATNGNPPARALHMHPTRTPHMHHSTTHAAKFAPIDQHGPDRGQSRNHPRVHTDRKSRRSPSACHSQARYAGKTPLHVPNRSCGTTMN